MYGRVQSIVHERFGPTLSQLCWLCVMSRLAVCDWLCVMSRLAACDWLCVMSRLEEPFHFSLFCFFGMSISLPDSAWQHT